MEEGHGRRPQRRSLCTKRDRQRGKRCRCESRTGKVAQRATSRPASLPVMRSVNKASRESATFRCSSQFNASCEVYVTGGFVLHLLVVSHFHVLCLFTLIIWYFNGRVSGEASLYWTCLKRGTVSSRCNSQFNGCVSGEASPYWTCLWRGTISSRCNSQFNGRVSFDTTPYWTGSLRYTVSRFEKTLLEGIEWLESLSLIY